MESSNSSRALPDELIMEILSRLPVKTLVRLSCVCKFWQTLITSDNFFIRCHLKNSVKSNPNSSVKNVLLDSAEFRHPRSCICREKLEHPHDHEIRRLTKKIRSYDTDYYSGKHRIIFGRYNFFLVGCCDGVICLAESFFGDKFTVHLCNPSLNQSRALPRSIYHAKSDILNTMLCFIFENDDYKVVKIIDDKETVMVETYSLSSNAWKPLIRSCVGVVSPDDRLVPMGLGTEFVVHNGFPYWFGWDSKKQEDILNVLDMNRKEIRQIPLPSCLFSEEFYPCLFYLIQIKGSLSISLTRKDSTYPDPLFIRPEVGLIIRPEVWMLKEDSTADICWTKQFVFPLSSPLAGHLQSRTTGYTATGKHLAVSSDAIFLFDQENPGTLEKFSMMDFDHSYSRKYVVADFVASLVSVITIPSIPASMKRSTKDDTSFMEKKKHRLGN